MGNHCGGAVQADAALDQFAWNDAARTLTIADRKGSYDGMIQKRTFRIVLPDGKSKTVEYDGKKIDVKL